MLVMCLLHQVSSILYPFIMFLKLYFEIDENDKNALHAITFDSALRQET